MQRIKKTIKYFSPKLKYNKVYLIPTLSGVFMLFILLSMLFASSIFGNNLAFIVTFVCSAVLLTSLLYQNSSLNDIKFEVDKEVVLENNSKTILPILLDNPHLRVPGIELEVDIKKESCHEVAYKVVSKLHAPEGGVRLSFESHTPGLLKIKKIRAFTAFPFGITKALVLSKCSMDLYVYPEPFVAAHQEKKSNLSNDNTEFKEHKKSDESTPLSRIDWNKYAKSGELLSKTFETSDISENEYSAIEINLDIIHSENWKELGRKTRSLLDQVYKANKRYAVIFKNQTISGKGSNFYSENLKRLATACSTTAKEFTS